MMPAIKQMLHCHLSQVRSHVLAHGLDLSVALAMMERELSDDHQPTMAELAPNEHVYQHLVQNLCSWAMVHGIDLNDAVIAFLDEISEQEPELELELACV